MLTPRLPKDSATWVMFLVGVGCLVYTGWQVFDLRRFLATAVHTTGYTCNTEPHPCIRFAAPDGSQVRFAQNGFVSRPLGAAVPVAYQAADPGGTAQAATWMTTWGMSLWTLTPGLGFTLLPLFGAEAYWRGFGLRG